MVTINNIYTAAYELAYGKKQASLKLALWAGAMSPMQELSKNCKQTRILAKYVNGRLPEKQTLFNELRKAKGFLTGMHINALYHIEAWIDSLDFEELEDLTDIGETYTEQCVWRERLHAVLNGHGIGRKTISFAALILDPLHCELVPVDRHVLARLGFDPTRGINANQPKKYLHIENMVRDERDNAGHSHISLGIWHWYKWEEWRQATGDSRVEKGAESHLGLSCREY